MNANTQPAALPEGACITARVPETNQALLGDIVVNPYKLAPLTAIIRDGGRTLSGVHVRVLGRGERGVDIDYPVSERALWTYGGIPVFGLYPDHVNQVEVSYKLDGERLRERYEIYAPAVRLPVVARQTAALPHVEPVTVAPGFEKRLYLFNHLLGDIPGGRAFKWNGLGGAAEWDQVGNNWIADSNGDVRWYLDIEQIHDSNRRDGLGGTMGFQQTRDGKLIWGQGQTYSKFDLLGRRVWQRNLPDKFADFSHEIRETSHGTYLLRVGTSDYRRPDGKRVRSIRDHIIEVDESGDVLDFWDLNQILDPYRGELLETLGRAALQLPEGVRKADDRLANELAEGDLPFGDTPGVGTGRNWAHVNAIDHDASDDSIIVSARHQGVVKIGRDKQVKWILASPKGWPSHLKAKVLTPVASEEFDWSWTQHTAWLTGQGTLTVFDNGWGRDFAPTRLEGNYSRAVEYRIDEAKLTVEQVWAYGKARGDEWYSPITSVVAYQPQTDTQLIYSASVGYLTPEKLTTSVLNEVRRGTQQVLVELKVHSRQPGSVGYRALVIDVAKAF
ncbi:aryl-sulfate sulfotransferase [Pseudomonas sp. S75]|uniref:aryl-sulfate sulfotransferase n=1 Tax=unclassified Pseudomonas TaxID=196821 RepID=UPI0019072793|nr:MULTISPECIES: aryl-sulfate sulfotransferase [unclassified Pseudomonas]MBJ9977584.1 aryl-sulfate sulfotransferase [Pseudomonas sp. S30]MBK0155248.1 aryl-sulfate sulfotransferase [Pseudomonas sp. S75]